MANVIKKIVLEDGTELDATALRFISLSSKGNLQIGTPEVDSKDWGDGSTKAKGNLNVESAKNVKIKAGNGGQLELIADNTGDYNEVVFKAVASVNGAGQPLADDLTIRLKLNLSELELNTKDSSEPDSCDIKFRTGKSTNKKYVSGKIKARSIDLRTYSTAPGTGGGVAHQISSCDSDFHENKFKIETDRKVPVELGLIDSNANWGNFYNGEGGKGMEIFTMNSQFMSAWARTYRFKGDAPIYAVTRGSLATDGDKVDFPTQADDSKDIINDESPITWNDLVKAVKYLKSQGVI